jgi:type II secretory pathway pseudopilin PulG
MTLLELVVMIIIASIITGSVMVRMASKNEYSVITQAEQMRRDLSHVQMLAIAWEVSLTVTATSTGYSVTCKTASSGTPCATAGATPIDPATGKSFSVTSFDNGVTIDQVNGATLSGSDVFYFDSLGRPISSSDTLVASSHSYRFTLNSVHSTVSVQPITGYASTS